MAPKAGKLKQRVSRLFPPRLGNSSREALGIVGSLIVALSACSHKSSSPPASQSQTASSATSSPEETHITGSSKNRKALFQETCATCHGTQGQGVNRLGADLQTNKFVSSSTDAQAVAFIERGITADDLLNKMHVAMPPKGGNPALTTQDLYDIVAFIRQMQRTHTEKN